MKRSIAIRIGAFLLCLLMILAVFSGCRKKKTEEPTDKTQKRPTGDGEVVDPETLGEDQYDLTAYNVVYTPSEHETNILAGMAKTLADRLTALTALDVTPRTPGDLTSNPDALEILIGKIDARQESVDAYNAIEGVGFIIRATENKICIVGSDHLCTIWAMQYFLDNCVPATLTTPVATVKTVKTDNREMIRVADFGGNGLPIVYSSDIWARADHADPGFRSLYAEYDMRAYPVKIAERVIQQLALSTSASADRFTMRSDATVAGGVFVFGVTDRAVERPFLNDLAGNEYGFFAGDGSCALASWSDIGLSSALNIFSGLLKEAVYHDENSNAYLGFPDGFKLKGVYNENWAVDFPKPEGEGISLYNTMDTGEGCLQFLYRGEGVCAEAFDAYKARLVQSGYTILMQNTMAENKFATLVSEEAGVMLSVAYDAFAHKDEYDYNANPVFDADNEDNYDYDFMYRKCLRIVSCPTNNSIVAVPDDSVLAPSVSASGNDWAWTKMAGNAITAIETISVGSGYIITLEDGSFIVIDGGGSTSDNGGSTESLYTLLSKRYYDIYGSDPDETHPIYITAWIITHSHGDHYGAACSFLDTYGKTTVRLKYLIGNWPASNEAYACNSAGNGYMDATGADRILRATGAKLLRVHTGQTYYFANIKVEVLMTTEDHNPFRVDNSNDTNTVLRFSVYASPTDPDPYTMIWLGDANRQQSRWMCAMYGSYLRSDMTSIGHHGNVGCDIELYDTIQAKAVWHPNNSGSFGYYTSNGSGYNGRPWRVDQALFGKTVAGDVLPARTYTQYLIFSGNDTGGTTHITLQFRNGRPDFELLRDTLTGSAITYQTSRSVRAIAYKLY